jgi:hypothetical protein
MSYGIICEGKTDFRVLQNLLRGITENKNLRVNRLQPEDDEPGGWPNVINYLSSEKFIPIFDFYENIVIHIDTRECDQWNEHLKQLGDDDLDIESFVETIKTVLINKIDKEFYDLKKDKIFFAICVHEIECWLLPYNSTRPSDLSKRTGCYNALKQINKGGKEYLGQKGFGGGKFYDDFSKVMLKKKDLLEKAHLNPSLEIFIDNLSSMFPPIEQPS